MIGVVPHLRREVEGDGEPRLTLIEEVAEAFVRFLGGSEAGVLSHRPESATVHRRINTACEGECAGITDFLFIHRFGCVERGAEGIDADIGCRREAGLSLAPFFFERCIRLLQPFSMEIFEIPAVLHPLTFLQSDGITEGVSDGFRVQSLERSTEECFRASSVEAAGAY